MAFTSNIKGILCLCLCTFFAHGSSVYKISNGKNTLYLGGTMHVLAQSDYPLSNAYTIAYKASDNLVFETDVMAMSSPAMQQKSVELLTFSDGRSLTDELSHATLSKLKAHLKSRNISYDMFHTMKPGLVGVTLSLIELQTMGLSVQGVDAYYTALALNDGKPISWLEEPEQQLHMLAKFGEDQSDQFIQYSLSELRDFSEDITALKQAWYIGDLNGLEEVGINDWKADYPELYQILLSDRNKNWMTNITSMMQSPPTEFILVGALHLAGNNGLIAQLVSRGFTVTQL
ncbi:TraB/GumN family protein [Alteromonas sp. 5E99-2]|uniref:TraB/GumN family protein n=1 Tax=Alteromonas sp. 5E99-2 TaxID=2817683 RepID=UPI001A9A28BB|nr:TraB/GumN family protein [Alteromonas sp. 5E99-2]MBO1255157.1 TraB/GumN family protein [Alteromonas sp. 5E99-2]